MPKPKPSDDMPMPMTYEAHSRAVGETEGDSWRIKRGGLMPEFPKGYWSAPAMTAKDALAVALSRFVNKREH